MNLGIGEKGAIRRFFKKKWDFCDFRPSGGVFISSGLIKAREKQKKPIEIKKYENNPHFNPRSCSAWRRCFRR
jgi:hypothetical protein